MSGILCNSTIVNLSSEPSRIPQGAVVVSLHLLFVLLGRTFLAEHCDLQVEHGRSINF